MTGSQNKISGNEPLNDSGISGWGSVRADRACAVFAVFTLADAWAGS
jgi:hypothetical protein